MPLLGPASRPAQKWWRRHLLTATGVAAGSVLVIKTDVGGGMAPNAGKCSEDEQGQELYIPMNNTYTFYACRNHGEERSAASLRFGAAATVGRCCTGQRSCSTMQCCLQVSAAGAADVMGRLLTRPATSI